MPAVKSTNNPLERGVCYPKPGCCPEVQETLHDVCRFKLKLNYGHRRNLRRLGGGGSHLCHGAGPSVDNCAGGRRALQAGCRGHHDIARASGLP